MSLSPAVRYELEDPFVLVYTGRSHFSSAMHQKVISEADRHRGHFDDLARAAVLGKEALLRGDIAAFAAAMNANWAAQKALHSDITTPEIEALRPSASPASAVLRMRTLPSREVVERFTRPEHSTNMPRGFWPSTNRIAPAGRTLLWLTWSRARKPSRENPQKN